MMNKRELLNICSSFIPKLTKTNHKGSHGRIGVIGGSLEYTGGPYFAAISALKAGADLVHVFCCQSAAPVIKSYSPELIVHPLLDVENAIEHVKPWLGKLHALVVGPGLGRHEDILNTVESVFEYYKSGSIPPVPIIIDADGLFLVVKKLDLFKGYNGPIILTPNRMELIRFAEAMGENSVTADKISTRVGAVVVQKGEVDVITSRNGKTVAICDEEGSFRRCGGQGDVLAGTMATFAAWQHMAKQNDLGFSAYAAAILTRRCSKLAFNKYKRSMVAGNLIEFIQCGFEELFEQ